MEHLLAVITVTYNAEHSIARTMASVLQQKFNDYEYIIMDGNSNDGTKNIIDKYSKEFAKNNIKCQAYSKKDDGIFDAMNTAIDYIDSKYVIFLNSGDLLCNDSVFNQISKYLLDYKSDIVYGDYFLYKNNRRKMIISSEIDEIVYGMITTHQAIFTKTRLLKDRKYHYHDYRMAADYDFYLDMYLQGKTFYHVNIPIVYFEVGGESQKNAVITQNDVVKIKFSYKKLTDFEMIIEKAKIPLICFKKQILGQLPDVIRFWKYERFGRNENDL